MRNSDIFPLNEAEEQLARAQRLIDQIPYLAWSRCEAGELALGSLERSKDAERHGRIFQWMARNQWIAMAWTILEGFGCIEGLETAAFGAEEVARQLRRRGMEQCVDADIYEGGIARVRGDAMTCLWQVLHSLSALSDHPQKASIKGDLARLESFAEDHDDIVELDQILERTRLAVRQCAGNAADAGKCPRQ